MFTALFNRQALTFGGQVKFNLEAGKSNEV